MTKLIVSKGGEVLREVPLSQPQLTIGRKAGHDIRIDDPRVSHDHAAIVTAGQASFIEDLGSTNGTLVNGAPITKHLLQNNDVITVGEHQLCYLAGDGMGDGADCCETLVIPTSRPVPPTPEERPMAAVEIGRPLPAWKKPKNQLAAALAAVALGIWGGRLYESYRVDESAPVDRHNAKTIECKALYSRVETETMSPEKAHAATLAAFKKGTCKD